MAEKPDDMRRQVPFGQTYLRSVEDRSAKVIAIEYFYIIQKSQAWQRCCKEIFLCAKNQGKAQKPMNG